MLYIILAIILLAAAITLLRVRIRVVLARQERWLFVGLGKSGHEQDFIARVGRVKLFGVNIKTLRPRKKEAAEPAPKKEKKPKKKKAARKRSLRDIIAVVPGVLGAATNYFHSLLKSIIVEELNGEIEAGFEAPDLTGQAYGYYQAALATTPSVVGRFRFTPVWTGQSFDGCARMALAIPLYKIILRTIILIFKLPLRKIIKLAIGTKKGDEDVQ